MFQKRYTLSLLKHDFRIRLSLHRGTKFDSFSVVFRVVPGVSSQTIVQQLISRFGKKLESRKKKIVASAILKKQNQISNA